MKLDTAEAVLTLVVGINALMSPQAPVFPMKEAQFLPIHISNWINLDCCFSVMCINVASESSEYIQTIFLVDRRSQRVELLASYL